MSLQTRCRNVLAELINELTELKVVVFPKNQMAYEKGDSTELMIECVGKNICEISFTERTYKISTTFIDWKEKTTYSGIVNEKVFSYNVDTLDECASEAKRMLEYYWTLRGMRIQKTIEIQPWPEEANAEERLIYMTQVSQNVLDGSNYEARKTTKDNEGCVNIFPKGMPLDASTRNRYAAIYVKKKPHFLVKEPLYSKIKDIISKANIEEDKFDEAGHWYLGKNFKQVVEILWIIAKAE